MEKKEQRDGTKVSSLKIDASIEYIFDFAKDGDEETRKAILDARNQKSEEACQVWDVKFKLPDFDVMQKFAKNIFTNSGLASASDIKLEIPWKLLFRAQTNFLKYLKGFYGELFLNTENNYLLLAFKGTESFKVLTTDVVNVAGGYSGGDIDTAFTFGEKVRNFINSFEVKPILLITGHLLGGFLAQICTYTITYCFVAQDGTIRSSREPSDFAIYTVVFDSPPALEKLLDIDPHDPIQFKYFRLKITNIIFKLYAVNQFSTLGAHVGQVLALNEFEVSGEVSFMEWSKNAMSLHSIANLDNYVIKFENYVVEFENYVVEFENILDDRLLRLSTEVHSEEKLVKFDNHKIPACFFTQKNLEQLRNYQILAAMCPEMVEKIPKFRLFYSYILLIDENLTPEEFIPRMHQVLSQFKYEIGSEIFADKLCEVLTEITREDAHSFVMNEEGKRSVQLWQDGTVIRGCQSYEEMRFYACLYYNSIENCYFCSYEKFVQINAETINNFASKTKPTIILIVDEDQNIQFQHQTYENMKIIYLVLEADVEKTNNTLHFSILEKNSQNALKAKKLNYLGSKVEAWIIFGSQLFQELRIFEIYDFSIAGEHNKSFYVNHAITCKNSKETFESATELVYRIKNEKPKLVVISGEAGMGKSTTLKQIAYELQQKLQNFWIVNLDPSQIEYQLSKAKPNSIMAAVELIRHLEFDKLKYSNEVHKKYFDHKLKTNGMVLLIDSLDKISSNCRAKVNHLIELLRHTGLHMIVTTRPHEGFNFSEEETFELERFNSKRKKMKFMKQIFKTLEVPLPLDYRAWFKEISDDTAKENWNNPLYLVMAFYLYRNDGQLQGERKLLQKVYELIEFLDNSIKNTLVDEMRANKSYALEKVTKYNHLLEILSICAVFHNGEVKDEYKKEISENGNFMNSFDIAKLESDNKTVSFLHKPFADFLVARIFFYQHKKEIQSPKLSIEQQRSVLMDETHFKIRQFICGLLIDSVTFQIAHEVIQGNEKKLLLLLIEEDCFELFLLLKEQLKVAHQNYVMETCDSAEKINLLYLAMKSSSKEFVKRLINDGAKFESVLQEEFVLHKAVEKGLNREVRLHFDELKKDIDKADDRGNFPLHYAAQNGSGEMVKFLIANGANVNQANASDQNALYFAIEAGSHELVILLIEKKVDTQFALKWAAELGQKNLFKKFLQHIKEDGLKEKRIQEALSSAAANGHLKMCRRLLDLKGEPTVRDEKGETSVHLAAAGGHLECVQRLLSKKANVDVRNSKGETPLMKALLNGHEEMVEWLLERNADLQAENAEGTKVSHYMAAYVLSKTMPTEELNDFKKVLKPISKSAKPLNP